MAAQRPRFPGRPHGDTGLADENVTATLASYHHSVASERDALLALSQARLLVPVVAMLTELDERTGGDKESEMALPTLIGNDGRAAIIAFTGLEELQRWRPDARPVPTPASRVWHAAVAERQSVVIDVAGPVPLVIEGARLAALATGSFPPLPHDDPDVRAVVSEIVAAEPGLAGFTLTPASSAADLAVTLRMASAADADSARRAAQAIAVRLAARFRRGRGAQRVLG